MKFVNTKKIKDYSNVFIEMEQDWDFEHYQFILTYCNIIEIGDDQAELYWKMWLVYVKDELIGICGLYEDSSKKRCWLGWFGIFPDFRKKGYGEKCLKFMEKKARKQGYDAIHCYCSDEPLQYYLTNGYVRIGTTDEFLKINCHETKLHEFMGEMNDNVLRKSLV
jgi:GNAT superfamily N-acetyltransferase